MKYWNIRLYVVGCGQLGTYGVYAETREEAIKKAWELTELKFHVEADEITEEIEADEITEDVYPNVFCDGEEI